MNLKLFIAIMLVALVEVSGFCIYGNNKLFECYNQVDADSDSVIFSELPVLRGVMISSEADYEDYVSAVNLGAKLIRLKLIPTKYKKSKTLQFWDIWPNVLDKLQQNLENARKAGLRVVIDMNRGPFPEVNRIDQPELWNRNDLEERFCRAWSDVAQRTKPYREIIWGYDIFNEPLDRSQLPNPPKEWRPLAEKIIEAIRKVDKETWIVFEPGPGGLFLGFKDLIPFKDKRVIYSAHFYAPHAFTHQGVRMIAVSDAESIERQINIRYPTAISNQLWNKDKLEDQLQYADEFQTKWKVPIYVGEFSVIRWAPEESAIQWLNDVIDLFESRNWSWTYHSFRGWNGWSLEHDGKFWHEGMPYPKPTKNTTERMKVIKKALSKN